MSISATRIDSILTNIFHKKYLKKYSELHTKLVLSIEKSLDDYFSALNIDLSNERYMKYFNCSSLIDLNYLSTHCKSELFASINVIKYSIHEKIRYTNYSGKKFEDYFNTDEIINYSIIRLTKNYPKLIDTDELELVPAYSLNPFCLSEYLDFCMDMLKDLNSLASDIKSYKSLTSLIEDNKEISNYIEDLRKPSKDSDKVGVNDNIKAILTK